MHDTRSTAGNLLLLRERLDREERQRLAPLASFSSEAVRRRTEERAGYRQSYSLDVDRILHSRAYTRYIDKTQVFYMIDNDHISHRVLHVQLVSKIARTIGRFLALNEDLIEAVSLGHDIGHPPFGHDGEKELAALCREHGLQGFQHNIQSGRFLDRLERSGRGWNLTLQVLDGILCHDGEMHSQGLHPCRGKDFAGLDRETAVKDAEPATPLMPMTLEGCVVRLSDTIAYIGRDIEDAIELRMIDRRDLPAGCRRVLGDTNGKIVYRLVSDLIANSAAEEGGGLRSDSIGFSPEIAESLRKLKEFNYERIYLNPTIKKGLEEIRLCYRRLFDSCLADIDSVRKGAAIFTDFLDGMESGYADNHEPAAVVRDFLAGMTDAYFLRQASACGCTVPEKITQV